MYEIFLLPVGQRDLDELESTAFFRVIEAIRALATDPRPPGCLKLMNEDGYRFRVGDFRILYRIEDQEKSIYVYRVKNRKDAYRR